MEQRVCFTPSVLFLDNFLAKFKVNLTILIDFEVGLRIKMRLKKERRMAYEDQRC